MRLIRFWDRCYLCGPAVDQALADEQLASLPPGQGGGFGEAQAGRTAAAPGNAWNPGSPGEVVWPLGDHLGTVRDLAVYDAQTDMTAVVNHRVFDSFGNVRSATDPATNQAAGVDCLFAFTGRPFDSTTGLQNNLNRWYDPSTARWLSQDPLGFHAGDANLSRYCSNAPIDCTDPVGLKKGPRGSPNATELLSRLPTDSRYWVIFLVNYEDGDAVPAGMGHAWIAVADTMTGAIRVVGFVPAARVSPSQPEAGGTFEDDSRRRYRFARAYQITAKQYAAIMKRLDSPAPPTYHIYAYNCTKWIIEEIIRKDLGWAYDGTGELFAGSVGGHPTHTPRSLARELMRMLKPGVQSYGQPPN